MYQPQIAKRPAYGGIQAQNNINVPVNNYQQSREWSEPDHGDEFESGENRGYGYDSEYDDAPPPYDSLYEEMVRVYLRHPDVKTKSILTGPGLGIVLQCGGKMIPDHY